MKARHEVDPELALLRTAVQQADGRERSQLEGARFQLFAAFEEHNADHARRWAQAVRAGLLALDVEGDNRRAIVAMAMRALDRIELAIGGPHRPEPGGQP